MEGQCMHVYIANGWFNVKNTPSKCSPGRPATGISLAFPARERCSSGRFVQSGISFVPTSNSTYLISHLFTSELKKIPA